MSPAVVVVTPTLTVAPVETRREDLCHNPFDVYLGQLPFVSLINYGRWSPDLMVLRVSSDKHIIIIAQDAAVYKVMDLFDVRCRNPG